MDTFDERMSVSAIVEKSMQWTWKYLFVVDRENSQSINRQESDRMQHRKFCLHGCSYQTEGHSIHWILDRRRKPERRQEAEDVLLKLHNPFTEELEERDASSSTPTGRGDLTHEVVEEQSHDEKLPSNAFDTVWGTLTKDIKSKKSIIVSQSRENHNAFTRSNCEIYEKKKQHESGVEQNQRSAWMGLHLLQSSETWSRQITKFWTWKTSRDADTETLWRAKWFHELDSQVSDEDKRKHWKTCRNLQKTYISVTEAGNNLHRQFQIIYYSLLRFTMESWHKHTSSLGNARSDRKSRPQNERRNSCRIRATRTTRRMLGLYDGILLLLTQRARQDDRLQNSIREHIYVKG